jgi:hypothetical protein
MRQKLDDKELAKALIFDQFNPGPYLAINGSYLGYYGTQESEWEEYLLLMKIQMEEQEAKVMNQARASGDKHTEKSLACLVAVDETYLKFKKSLAVATAQKTAYKNAYSSLQAAANNCRSLETSTRADRERSFHSTTQ